MAQAEVEIIYKANAQGLEVAVGKITQTNDELVKGATETSKKVADEFKKIGGAAAAAFGSQQVKAALDQLNKESDKLTTNLKELQKEQVLLVASGNRVSKAYQDNVKAQQALKVQISQVNQEQQELNRTFDQTENKQKSLTSQLRGLKQELAQLETQGKENTDEFNKLLFAAAKLEDQIGDTRERVRVLASDTFKFDAAVGATQALASGFEVAQGAAALFGSEGKELQEVIAKTTAVTAIANGVNELANQITGKGPLKLALYEAGQKAVAVATAISTGAISAFRVALAATGIVAFVAGVALLVDRLRDAADNQAAFNRVLELSKAAAEGTRKAINDLSNSTLDTATKIRIANGDLTQSEADRRAAVAETQKSVESLLKTETGIREKAAEQVKRLSADLAKSEESDRRASARTGQELVTQGTKNLAAQLLIQENVIKDSEKRVQTLRESGQVQIAATNKLFAAEENEVRREEAKKLAEDAKKAAEDAAKAELEARNAAREKLRQLELDALATQLDDREKVLSDSNAKITELEATFAEGKFAKGSVEEKKLQDSITLIKEQATKDIAEIDQKALDDKAAKEKEAAEKAKQEAEKLAQEKTRIAIAGIDAEIDAVKTLEITEGTSLDRRIELIKLNGKKRIEEAQGNAAKIKLINAETEQAIQDENDKSTKKAIDNAFAVANAVADTLGSIINLQGEQSALRIEEIDAESQKQAEAIERSTETEINKQRQLDALRLRTNQKIAQEKARQAQSEKIFAIFTAIINTAAEVTKNIANPVLAAITAAAGLAQIAIISAQPVPKFKKGGPVGGKSHEAGGTLIEAEKGEYVVNKSSVSQHRKALDAMNTSSAAFKKFIDEKYVRPAIAGYAMNSKRDGITVNASLNSKSMEKKLDKLNKTMAGKQMIVNINGSDSRYSWQQN
jgi:predicted  nucleic acid-binding Zn-ribbon protein